MSLFHVRSAPRVDAEEIPPLYDHALRDVVQNVTFTKDTVMAWFVREPVAWNYRSNEECKEVIATVLRSLLPLAGCGFIHERTIFMPHPIAAWARNLKLNTPNPVNPAAWQEYLRAAQAGQVGRSLGEPMSFIGVPIAGRSTVDAFRDRLGKTHDRPRERAKLVAGIAEVTQHLTHLARPATQREVEWLLHRSRGLLLPVATAPATAGDEPLTVWDLAAAFDSVDVPPQPPFSPHVKLVAAAGRSGQGVQPLERYVSVLSIGRMGTQIIPEKHTPWLAKALQRPGVELSVRYEIVPGALAAKAITSKTDLILDQKPQYAVYGIPPPPNVDRTYDLARRVRDEMEEGHAEDATRFDGWPRLAVSGSTPEKVAKAVHELKQHMATQRIDVEHPRAQEALAREFIPGEPLATTAHRRRMKLVTYAGAVQHVSSTLGDGKGPIWGHTVGISRSPFMWDLHRAMEELDQSGVTPVVGVQGSGKSGLLGFFAAISAFQGNATTCLDPGGQLANITQWEPIRAHSGILDVVRASISPFGVIPVPRREYYEDDPQVRKATTYQNRQEIIDTLWHEAVVGAEFERKALALDTVRGSLEPELRAHPETLSLLSDAIRRTGGKFDATLATVLEDLRSKGGRMPTPSRMRGGRLRAEQVLNNTRSEQSMALYAALRDVAEHPRGRFMTAVDTEDINAVDKTLLVVVLGGVAFPRMDVPESTWSTEERLSLPLLNLAAHLVASRIYRGDKHQRKTFCVDEAALFMVWASGRALVANFERHSRKLDARIFIASQDAKTTLSAQTASKALINDAICLATTDPDEQIAQCDILGMSHDFAPTFAKLRPPSDKALPESKKWRDGMFRINGEKGRVRIDSSSTPDLKALLNTSPTKIAGKRGELAYGEW